MKSVVAMTTELDDLDLAVEELAAQVRAKFKPAKNSVGIVYCDADVDVAEFGGLLHEELGIDIVGLTTTATIERKNGYDDMGILLALLTADDVTFTIGCTGELDAQNYSQAIRETYQKDRLEIEEDPALILSFFPYISDITADEYLELLDELSHGAPIFGGVATDHYDLQYQKTFLNGQAFAGGLIFVLLSGNVQPVFALKHHFDATAEKKGVVAKSTGNLVQKVGDQTFLDFISSMMPVADEEEVIYHFQSTPFIIELPDSEAGEEPAVRVLHTIDHETGAGGFLSKIPEGSALSLNEFERNDLGESCRDTLSDICQQITGNKDYQYSMLFICTCNARHLLMGDSKDLESDILSEKLSGAPSEVNAMGFYGFGEICPTGKRADGTARNRFHNVSFAVCAL